MDISLIYSRLVWWGKKEYKRAKKQAWVSKGKACVMPISINNKKDFNFDNIISDILSSRTALGP
jgi:hypothetical protein